MSDFKPIRSRSFDEAKRGRWRASLFVFGVILFVYLVGVGNMLLAALATFWIFTLPGWAEGLATTTLIKFVVASIAISVVLAALQFWEARYHGARTILELMRALPPDPRDRYHQVFVNATREMALAAGVPRIDPLILPTHALNSIALIASDGAPIVAVSEGMLAECDRDELQAAIAHEMAHILSGDTFYVTLVCSLAAFFDKIRENLEPDDSLEGRGRNKEDGPAFPLLYFAALNMSLLLRGLCAAISRQREMLADAAAADYTRHPDALARVIYKAQLSYSFLGDFSRSMSPLFIVAPDSEAGKDGGLMDRIFATHPPVERRVEALAELAGSTLPEIVKSVWDGKAARDAGRPLLDVVEAMPTPADALDGEAEDDADKRWHLLSHKGEWRGPFTPAELVAQPRFTPRILVREGLEGVTSPAREFVPIFEALRLHMGGGASSGSAKGCPVCRRPLHDEHYEGVGVMACKQCGGKMLRSREDARKVMVRRGVGFSAAVVDSALAAAQGMMLNPLRMGGVRPVAGEGAPCGLCNAPMTPRPFSYQFFLPIDECLHCGGLWFDANELEFLQVWVEHNVTLGRPGGAAVRREG